MIIKAILLMGGSGTRFGSKKPKQFHRIAGKAVYLHTLESFLQVQLFAEIVLVCHEDWLEQIAQETAVYGPTIRVVPGARSRQESSRLGLQACGDKTDFVVIHDAVRPFVNEEIIRKNIDAVIRHKAVDTCIPSADTIVHSHQGETIAAIPRRSEYLRGQTPQSFAYPLICQAHEKYPGQEASDDCSLVVQMGYPIHIVAGSDDNIKITTELDIHVAEMLLRMRHRVLGSPSQSLQGKKIAITGGTGGIGQAIAKLLIKEGAAPLIIARTSSDFPCDVTSLSDVEKTFARLGEIDGLINCVGNLMLKDFEDFNPDEIHDLIRVNLVGPIFSCKYAQIKSGGHLINVSSSSYSRGRKGFSIYSATKAALVNFTQSLAEERTDLSVNVVVPSRTNTLLRKASFPEESDADLLDPLTVAQTIVDLLKVTDTTGSIVDIRKK